MSFCTITTTVHNMRLYNYINHTGMVRSIHVLQTISFEPWLLNFFSFFCSSLVFSTIKCRWPPPHRICICTKTNRWFRLSTEVFFFGMILSHRRLNTIARWFFRNGWSKLSWASAYQWIPWTCGWYFWIPIASIPTASSAGSGSFFAYRAKLLHLWSDS